MPLRTILVSALMALGQVILALPQSEGTADIQRQAFTSALDTVVAGLNQQSVARADDTSTIQSVVWFVIFCQHPFRSAWVMLT